METYLGGAAALGAALVWTFSVLIGTAVARRIGAMSLNLPRLAMAWAFFSAYELIAHGRVLPDGATGTSWLLLMLSGVVGLGVADLCLFRALATIGPRLAMLVNSLYPAW